MRDLEPNNDSLKIYYGEIKSGRIGLTILYLPFSV